MTFQPFSTEHFLALAIGGTFAAGFLLAGKKGGKPRQLATALLAFFNLTAYPIHLIAWRGYPKTLDNILPLHLCDLAAILAGLALATRKPILCSLTYFWGLAATLQALLTPAITIGPPAAPFISFFIHHFAIVTAALYLPIVLGWRPKLPLWKTLRIVLGISIAYQLSALAINTLLGTNFAFASRPPDNPSLIDHLGPWPLYLMSMQALALVFFSLLCLPFVNYRKDKGIPATTSQSSS